MKKYNIIFCSISILADCWTVQRFLDPPPLHYKVNNEAHGHNRNLDADEQPVLAVEQHHGTEGPSEELAESGEDAGKRSVVEGERLVLGIDNAQQDEADRKDASGIAEDEQRALKPAALVHGGAKVHQRDDNDENAEEKQQRQRHGVLDDDAEVDGGNAEEYEIVCAGAGDTACDIGINVVIHMRFFENVEEQQTNQEGIQVGGTVKIELIVEELIEQTARAGGDHKDRKVPRERIKYDRGGRRLTELRTVFLGNKTGLQLTGEIAEIADVLCPALFGAELNEEHAAEHSGRMPTVAQV